MQGIARRSFFILALAAFAWLAGASQHAAMGIKHALGGGLSALCSADGPKFKFTGDGPGVPAKAPAGEGCQVCAQFDAPAAAGFAQIEPGGQSAPAPRAVGFITTHAHHTERLSARAPPVA